MRSQEKGEKSEAPLDLPTDVKSGNLETAPKKVDLLIVGAGLSGAVIAERASKEQGLTSLVIDVRDHIGGNCYDYVDEHGIRTSKYGAHLFHTKFERVWEYVQQFSRRHRRLATLRPPCAAPRHRCCREQVDPV